MIRRMRDDGEGERAVLGFFLLLLLLVGVGRVEIDARATLQGGEKGGDDGSAYPAAHVVETINRNDAVVGIVFFRHNSVFFHHNSQNSIRDM